MTFCGNTLSSDLSTGGGMTKESCENIGSDLKGGEKGASRFYGKKEKCRGVSVQWK